MPPSTAHWARRGHSDESPRAQRIHTEVLHDEPSLPAYCSTDDLASGRPLGVRLTSAALRRLWWAVDSLRRRPPAAEAALDWLSRSLPLNQTSAGLAACSGQFDPCPGLTAGVLATLAAYGQVSDARRMATWLAQVQLDCGAFPDAGLRQPSATNTAQAAKGLLSAAACIRDRSLIAVLDRMCVRACAYLVGLIDRQDMFSESRGSMPQNDVLSWIALAAPVLAAAERFGQSAWNIEVERVCQQDRGRLAMVSWQAPLHLFMPEIEALVELQQPALARTALGRINAAQRRDGAVPAVPGATWVSTTGLAQLATIWYRLGQRDRAGQAVAWLCRRQQSTGGFLGSYGRGACYYPRREVAWAAKHFLDACQLQVETSFADDSAQPRAWIDPADGRLQAVKAWCSTLAAGSRIADVGCGHGRYLMPLAESFPSLGWLGVDPSPSCLEGLLPAVDAMRGGLLNLPLDDGALDAAMAIESLEHALVPRRGVAELCRIVRSGGRILIIDKQRSHQALSRCEPWERWFTREEISGWLAAHCSDVKCVAVPHARHRQPTGLFLCWTATRR